MKRATTSPKEALLLDVQAISGFRMPWKSSLLRGRRGVQSILSMMTIVFSQEVQAANKQLDILRLEIEPNQRALNHSLSGC
jgi:hypothetical protein